MTTHSLRTLVKQYHPEALALLGYDPKLDVAVTNTSVSAQVRLGEALEWNSTVECRADGGLLATLAVHFPKANGSLSKKVFALIKTKVSAGDVIELTKRLPFKPLTTRTLYPGTHIAELAINGNVLDRQTFEFEE